MATVLDSAGLVAVPLTVRVAAAGISQNRDSFVRETRETANPCLSVAVRQLRVKCFPDQDAPWT